jgi:hypothetical protein
MIEMNLGKVKLKLKIAFTLWLWDAEKAYISQPIVMGPHSLVKNCVLINSPLEGVMPSTMEVK